MKNESSAVKEKARAYIKQSVHVDSNKINDDTLVFKEGFLDSMAFIVLITYLEDEFKIKTSDSDLIEENFESINAIADFVFKKSQN